MGLSLYIHFPFCTNICSYCDFYKETYNKSFQEKYFETLGRELNLCLTDLDYPLRIIDTVYFGGGTPSLMNTDHLKKFIDQCRNEFDFADNCEFSFEINPESIDADYLARLKEIGVNRPLLGFQSFCTRHLKALNRKHNLDDSFRAVYLIRALGFKNFGVDMIFGLPEQTSANLGDDLLQVTDLNPPHISYYQLTVEPGTVLHGKVESGAIRLPGTDLSAAMYHAIYDELRRNNYYRYEISSFAKPGFECQHNLRYWDGGAYLGLGPSAHSLINGIRFSNISNLKDYLDQVSKGTRPVTIDTRDRNSHIYEAIMLGLRTSRGIHRLNFKKRFGIGLETAVDSKALTSFRDRGFIDNDDQYVKLTDTGLPLADEIIRRLV